MLQNNVQISSRIVEIESKITTKIIKEKYRPTTGDDMELERKELYILRCLYYGYDSPFCLLKKGTHGSP
jgi:hypothetical protein